jgi:hypothetical protein
MSVNSFQKVLCEKRLFIADSCVFGNINCGGPPQALQWPQVVLQEVELHVPQSELLLASILSPTFPPKMDMSLCVFFDLQDGHETLPASPMDMNKTSKTFLHLSHLYS